MATITLTLDASGNVLGQGIEPIVGIPAALTFSGGLASVDAAQIVPLQAVPNQIVSVTLGNQPVTVKVYGKDIQVPYQPPNTIVTIPPSYSEDMPVFVDLYLNDVLIVSAALASNNVRIVRNLYLGFQGDLAIVDTQGTDDPVTSGLGSRWVLCYWPDIV